MIQIPLEFEKFRVQHGRLRSGPIDGPNGFFVIPSDPGKRRPLDLIISDGKQEPGISQGWEHISFKVRALGNTYTPIWDEIVWVKRTFWEPEDLVIQIIPPESKYYNVHPNVLHLWRNFYAELPLPPRELL